MKEEYAADFLGSGLHFPPAIDPLTGRIEISTGEEDIAEAIRVILFTGKGERVMRPDFGCGIRKYAFSDMSMITQRRMEQEILEALVRWEPRITKTEVSIHKERMQEGILEIEIHYLVRSTNNPYNMVFPFYINEGI